MVGRSRVWVVWLGLSACAGQDGRPEPASAVPPADPAAAPVVEAPPPEHGGNPDAGEGARAKREEGKVGKRESRIVGNGAGLGGLGSRGVGIGGGGTAVGLGGQGTVGHGVVGYGAIADGSTGEQFTDYGTGARVLAADDPLSTLSIDVDTGSYTIARRKLAEGVLPPPEAVRVEEFVNYLPYGYAPPSDDAPVAVHLEAAPHPFEAGRALLRVGLKAREIPADDRKPVHLTFLVDVSGSMQGPDRLGLAKQALRYLVDQLGPEDSVAMATYAGSTRIALEPTPVTRRAVIHEAIEGLDAGGSTAMNSGIALAYELARRTKLAGCENRVVLLSDGDANVGPSSFEENLATIANWAGQGITLSTVGFGTGNLKDTLMEQLADKGDGNYSYVDSFDEAKRVFGQNLAGTVHTVARDVKIQVAFEPASVIAWRLVGYENRDIADVAFRDDKVDAGELGSGHSVTALYELLLTDHPADALATVRFRAKPPGDDAPAREWATSIATSAVLPTFTAASPATRIAVGAATFAELLRHSPYVGEATYSDVAALIDAAKRPGVPEDAALAELVRRADALDRAGDPG